MGRILTGNYGSVRMKNPLLLVGIGGVGTRLAATSKNNLRCDCMLISNDKKDLNIGKHDSIFIDSQPWLNPSSHKIRSLGIRSEAEIRSCLDAHSTIVLVANLAGRCGTAIAPLISKISKENTSKKVISFVIMPFRFEKNRIFQAGVSLRRLRESSDATVVVDNDALLSNNPELSLKECYEITNNAICEVISSISETNVQNPLSLLCTGGSNNKSVESHVKDCLAMLYENSDPSAVRMVTLYLMGGTELSVGTVNSIANTIQEILKQQEVIDVCLSMPSSRALKAHLLAAVQETTRFDNYDPLAALIPRENILDWEEMESSPDIEITIPNIE
jgi:cell division protein FtsZ